MKKLESGLTVIETIILIVLLAAAGAFFMIQKNNFDNVLKDDKAKTAINAMYYSLEKVFYVKNGYYPQTIDSSVLTSVDPELFVDPNGVAINAIGSEYTYTPINCNDNKCQSYTLRANLINEADYVKTAN